MYKKETQLLREQMELLAEQSRVEWQDSEINGLSRAMVEIYKTLLINLGLRTFGACFFVALVYLFMHFVVFVH